MMRSFKTNALPHSTNAKMTIFVSSKAISVHIISSVPSLSLPTPVPPHVSFDVVRRKTPPNAPQLALPPIVRALRPPENADTIAFAESEVPCALAAKVVQGGDEAGGGRRDGARRGRGRRRLLLDDNGGGGVYWRRGRGARIQGRGRGLAVEAAWAGARVGRSGGGGVGVMAIWGGGVGGGGWQ